MLAILNSLSTHNFSIFQPILIILVSKLMVHRALSDKTYLSLGLMSPLIMNYTTGLAGIQLILNKNLRMGLLGHLCLFGKIWYLVKYGRDMLIRGIRSRS